MFTYLMENLGVQGVQFEELLTLEPETLRSLRCASSRGEVRLEGGVLTAVAARCTA